MHIDWRDLSAQYRKSEEQVQEDRKDGDARAAGKLPVTHTSVQLSGEPSILQKDEVDGRLRCEESDCPA